MKKEDFTLNNFKSDFETLITKYNRCKKETAKDKVVNKINILQDSVKQYLPNAKSKREANGLIKEIDNFLTDITVATVD